MDEICLELLSPCEMAEIDRLAIEGGIPRIELIERAGVAVAHVVLSRFTPRPTLVLCGPGNNGADGFIAATVLQQAGWPVRVALSVARDSLGGDAALAAERWTGAVETLSVDCLSGQELVIDALYGAGLDRPITGIDRSVVIEIGLRRIDTVSIDIPSGVKGDTGEIPDGIAVKAKTTVTFHRRKPGHLLFPGRLQCGELVLADIGLGDPPEIQGTTRENRPGLWIEAFPWPEGDTDKYKRGHALVVGGEMTGAGRLASHAAQRIGAGVVTVGCPPECVVIYSTISPSLIVKPVASAEDIKSIIETRKVKAVLAGPGGGVGDALAGVIDVILNSNLPAVFDADALSVLAQHEGLRSRLAAHHVLTPHEGEFRRLFDFEGSRIERARRASLESGATILLKGMDTIIARPDGFAAINTNATPWLATGGSGDTLAGFITGLLAQGMTPFDAACAATWIHCECAVAFGPGLIADDLANEVPGVLKQLLSRYET